MLVTACSPSSARTARRSTAGASPRPRRAPTRELDRGDGVPHERSVLMRRRLIACLAAALPGAALAHAQAPAYDVVIQNGRVIDPESGLDAVRSLGIRGGRIAAVSGSALRGRLTIDARGLVVAPGFIDLHVHGQNDENYRVYALDGVTTALELEVGVGDVPAFYSSHDGKALINYGASAGHIRARMAVLHDGGTARGTLLPLDSAAPNA